MSTTLKAGWLKDSQGNKFAPKTMSSQVIKDDGTLLEDSLNLKIDELASNKSDIDHNHDDRYDMKGSAEQLLEAAKEYTNDKIANLDFGSVTEEEFEKHNIDQNSHGDIRELISELTTRLNTLANSTDVELDQMAELVEYIKANRDVIESITTNKINVSDIVNDLETNNTSKVLSAATGVIIKQLIDSLQNELDTHGHNIADIEELQTILDSKVNDEDFSSHTSDKSNPHEVTLSQLGVTATEKELNYMSGVTSAVQPQIDAIAEGLIQKIQFITWEADD